MSDADRDADRAGSDGGTDRDCPDCDEVMDRTERSCFRAWRCKNSDCDNSQTYTYVFDWSLWCELKRVQIDVGDEAADRVAAEYDGGVLA